jgi:hypothetical protein
LPKESTPKNEYKICAPSSRGYCFRVIMIDDGFAKLYGIKHDIKVNNALLKECCY